MEKPNVIAHSVRWRTLNPIFRSARNVRARETAKALLQRLGQTALPGIIEQISTHNSSKCELFLPILLESNEPGAQEAVRKLLTEYVRRNSRKRIPWIRFAISVGLIIIINGLLITIWQAKIGLFSATVIRWFIEMGIVVGVMSGLCQFHLSDGLTKSLIRKCSQRGGTEWLGTMLFFLNDSNMGVSNLAEEGLLEILPQLKASDSSRISAEDMLALIRALSVKRPRLAHAILKALEQVGDERALSKVEHLIDELEDGTGPMKTRLREAAEACLPHLRQRAEIASQARTLLRASAPSHEEAQSILLRPTYASGATDSSELLRATASAENA